MKIAVFIFVATVVLMTCGEEKSARSVNEYGEVDRCDHFVDRLVKDMIEERGHEYDPYPMNKINVKFVKTVIFVNVTGIAKLGDGYMTGLRTLNRSGNCSLRPESDRLGVRVNLRSGVLNFNYSGSAKFMGIVTSNITVHGQLSYVEVEMKFSVDAVTGRNGTLDEFNIDDSRDMKVSITGLGTSDWTADMIKSGAIMQFKRNLRDALERVRKDIDQRLPKYKFPVPN